MRGVRREWRGEEERRGERGGKGGPDHKQQ